MFQRFLQNVNQLNKDFTDDDDMDDDNDDMDADDHDDNHNYVDARQQR